MNSNSNISSSEVVKILNDNNSFILITHVHPDPDAYGSLIAMAHVLKAQGKEVCCVNESAPAEHLDYLKGNFDIDNKFPESDYKKWEIVITLDCGDAKRVGDELKSKLEGSDYSVLNIDHHTSNDFFGDSNYVIPTASSTCEILYEIFSEANYEITSSIATLLLTGIMADTGSFRYSSTSQRTLSMASELVKLGAITSDIGKNLWGRVSLGALKLQSAALLNTEFFAEGKIALVVVTDEMLKKYGATIDATDSLTEKIRDIDGVVAAASIREYEDIWKISLRSHNDAINVASVAEYFGGGGHKPAAAFRWKKDFKTLKKALIDKLEELVMES